MDVTQSAVFLRSQQPCLAHLANTELSCDLCRRTITQGQWYTRVRIDGTMYLACIICRPFEMANRSFSQSDVAEDQIDLSLSDVMDEKTTNLQ